MTSTRAELKKRRADQRRLAEQRRAELAERRAQHETDRADRYQRARETGAELITVRPVDGLTLDLGGAEITGGVVEILNAPGHLFDFRVTVEVHGVELVHEGGEIRVEQVGTLRPVITSLEVLRRVNGPDISAQRMQRERLGEVSRIAVAALARTDGGGVLSISEHSARELLRVRPRRGRGAERSEELEIVANAYHDAATDGRPRHALIAQRLAAAGFPHGARTCDQLVRRCKDLGLIDTTEGTTRPRLR